MIQHCRDCNSTLVVNPDGTSHKDCPGLPAPEMQAVVRPIVVCLCGSTRFKDEFVSAGLRETLDGKIVLTIGCNMRTDQEVFGHLSPEELTRIKIELDALHFRKIELADEVLILNVGGYIGDSTRNELRHALSLGKVVRWLEPNKASDALAALDRKEQP